ncbi:hypothetical protein [Streptomyces violascens]|uniref:hypothetical protein n=1 Tax=Streptomyces violascens TaxID=67381 RepID=UPI0036A1F2F8
MTKAVLIALAALIALTLVCLIAMLVHGRIAGQAIRRARAEDLPQMLETSGRTLVDLFGSLRRKARRLLPGAGTDQAAAAPGRTALVPRSEQSAAEADSEGAEQ